MRAFPNEGLGPATASGPQPLLVPGVSGPHVGEALVIAAQIALPEFNRAGTTVHTAQSETRGRHRLPSAAVASASFMASGILPLRKCSYELFRGGVFPLALASLGVFLPAGSDLR